MPIGGASGGYAMIGQKQALFYFVTGMVCFLLVPVSHVAAQDSDGSAGANSSLSELADRPLYLAGGRGVPGNLILTPSVEYPTIQSLANLDQSYQETSLYVGYFDSGKCYEYSYSDTDAERHFFPTSMAVANSACAGVNEWSGNFLNWATTQTIDPFRKALTGGYRVKDTETETWLEKARHPGQSGIPERSVNGEVAARATPFTDKVSIKIEGMEKSMQFVLGDEDFKALGSEDLKNYDPGENRGDDYNNFGYLAAVRVKVCDPTKGLEPNCVDYGNGWKPEGLIQRNAGSLRYSVFGYLNDNSDDRDGAALRAGQRDVTTEWNSDTGVIISNPDGASEGNSGVINYINKFGQLNTNSHKSLDPVSELYYAATRYLKNQGNVSAYTNNATTKHKDGFPVLTDWDDPMLYECQATAILGIGDANTHDDGNLPGTSYRGDEPGLPAEVSSDSTVNVATMTNRIGVMEPGLDGTLGDGQFTGRENTAYIAGLAYDNHINDMRPDLDGDQLASTHWVDVLEGERLECPEDNQYYLAAKYGGFTLPADYDPERTEALPDEWWTTGETLVCNNSRSFKRPENFYTAGDASKMVDSLGKAFDSIVTDATGSSTSVTFNTATIESDTLLFGAEFNSADWTGNLYATAIERTTSGPPTIADDYSWEAGEVLGQRLASNPRNIYTYTGSSGIEFITANLNSFSGTMQADLGFGGSTDLAESRINYLRGSAITGFRVRGSLLGDVVNSTPVYIKGPSMSWPNSADFGSTDDRYSVFAQEQKDRAGVIYVGANDGMLHAFAADTGEELFAYIPEFLASASDGEGLHYLTEPAYSHRYYADLSPVVSEVYTQGAGSNTAKDWRSVLVGGARTGGKGIFALDITSPDEFANGATEIPMWEFTAEDDPRLGYITEPPTISLAQWGSDDYRWTVFLPNGYLSETSSTGIFMLDIEGGLDGTWSDTDYMYIEFDSASDASGLSPVRQVDLQGNDRVVDRIYAGDLKGNIWVASYGSSGWVNTYGGPLFTATDGSNAQPITAAPLAIRYPEQEEVDSGNGNGNGNGNNNNNNNSPSTHIMLLFGTGKYLELNDVNNTQVQSFYGVFDSVGGLDRDDLVVRTLTSGEITTDNVTYDVRTSDGDPFDPTTQSGWYVDLIDSGERINLSAQVRGDYVFVNSWVPTTNPCDIGGGGWLMAFGLDGRTPDRTIWPKIGEPVVGYKVTGGVPNQTTFIDDYSLTPLSNSDILPDEIDVGASSTELGRRSWQELYD